MWSQEEESLKVVKSFISVMDNQPEDPCYDISDDAVMDWFGRTIYGRASIIRFVREHFLNCQHKVEEIVSVPHLSHRLLKPAPNKVTKQLLVQQENINMQEGGTEQRTPDNPIRPNFEELRQAPKRKKQQWTVNCTDLEFLEIKGSLQYENIFFDETSSLLVKRDLKKILLGYSDEIHFIVYKSVIPSCKFKLSHRFKRLS